MRSIEARNGKGTIDIPEAALQDYTKALVAATGIPSFLIPPYEAEEMAEDLLGTDLETVLRILEQRDFHGFKTIRALVAHGNSTGLANFWYTNGAANDETQPRVPVQSWVNRHDGKYDVLFISCCNPSGSRLSSRASFLVYPNQGLFTREDIEPASKLFLQPPNPPPYTR